MTGRRWHRTIICLVYGLIITMLQLQPGATEPNSLRYALDDVLGALEKAFEFFNTDAYDINLDGFFGFRVAEGQVKLALDSPHIARLGLHMLARLEGLAARSERIAKKIEPNIAHRKPKYYHRFKDTIHQPYTTQFIRRNVTAVHLPPSTHSDRVNYDEEKGDGCYGDLMGSNTRNGVPVPVCTITNECWEMMTRDQGFGYVTTHQLLFFIAAEHVGCKYKILQKFGQEQLESFEKAQCSKIYVEAKILAAEEGGVRDEDQDLFAEQGLLCSMIGFTDFLRSDWLHMLLSWQDKSGCFKNIHRPNTGRKLLVERQLDDGCLSHKSGLATGLLGVYIRYIVQFVL